MEHCYCCFLTFNETFYTLVYTVFRAPPCWFPWKSPTATDAIESVAVADPRFTRVFVTAAVVRAPTYYFGKFPQKLMNMKKKWTQRRLPGTLLDPQM